MTAKPPPDSPGTPSLAVIGAGSWGTTLARLLGEKGLPVHLWVHEPEVYQDLSRNRINHTFLPGVRLSSKVRFTQDFDEALKNATVAVMAVPSHVFREVLGRLAPQMNPGTLLLSATKGIETESLLTMDGVVREVLGAEYQYAVLGGAQFRSGSGPEVPHCGDHRLPGHQGGPASAAPLLHVILPGLHQL